MNWEAACKDKLHAHKLRNKQTPNPPSSIINSNHGNEVLKQICVGEVFDMFNFSLWQYSDDYSSIILPFYLVRTKPCGQRGKRREGENRMIDT